MDNPTGLAFLSSALTTRSYLNQISLSSQNQSNTTDVRDLHKYLMKAISSGVSSSNISITLHSSLLDEPFHYDFTYISHDWLTFFRGGSIYNRPCGWKRYALKVKGKYPDDIWLEGKTRRADQFSSAEDEWAVSYHGTSYHNGLSIAEEGYKLSKGKRFAYGKGIYSTPDIEIASKYATTIEVNGKNYKFVMQNRVNPKNIKKIPNAEAGKGEYWISPTDDDIRPYGFCVREIRDLTLPTIPFLDSEMCLLQ